MAMNRRISISLLALATALAVAPAGAQVTDIVPDTLPDRDLGTSVTTIGNVSTIDNGTLSGTNLFHSFQTFDLAQGDVAQWVYTPGDPSAITNVINRVTGGTPSSLFGQLDSTAIPNADFFFINPAGIVFGAGAEVNVPAAAHFSTASELRFANGDVLAVATPSGSILSVAAPAAFGFLGGEGDISLTNVENHVATFLTNGGPLTLTAANLVLDNAFIGSSALALSAVGDQSAEIGLDGISTDLLSGLITMTNGSWLQTWPGNCFDNCLGNAGTIRLDAGDIEIISSSIVADFDSPVPSTAESFVELFATNSITLIDAILMSNGYDAIGPGAIRLTAGATIDAVDSFLFTLNSGDGPGGLIALQSGDIRISGGYISTEAYGAGDAGTISITAEQELTIENDAWLFSNTEGDGNAGRVGLTGTQVTISDSKLSSSSISAGDAGAIAIESYDELSISNSSVTSETSGGGAAGGVILLGVDIAIDSSKVSSDVLAGDGDAGQIAVFADTLALTSGSSLSSTTEGDGAGGGIAVFLNGQLLVDGSAISTNSKGAGDGGAIIIEAGELAMDQGVIESNAYGSGAGGFIEIEVLGDATMWASDIFSDSFGTGDAGLVALAADNLLMQFSSISSDALSDGDGGLVAIGINGSLAAFYSRISSDTGDPLTNSGLGNAGAVLISAQDILFENSEIRSLSWGDGDGGAIGISATNALSMVFTDITTDTQGAGIGGDIAVVAGSLKMDISTITSDTYGDGAGGSVTVDVAGTFFMEDFSYISTDAISGSGFGGDVLVTAANALLENGSFISSDTYGDGAAGSVTVDVDNLLHLTGESYISSDARDGTGFAGFVEIRATSIYLGGMSLISSDALADGDGGFVDVLASERITLDGQSRISTNVSGFGFGGSVTVAAPIIALHNGSSIASTGTETSIGDAGDVWVTADELMMFSGSSIASDANGLGESGIVLIETGAMTMTGGATVSTRSMNENQAGFIFVETGLLSLTGLGTAIASENLNPVEGGDNAAGSVFISAGNVVIAEGARVATNSLTGSAGNITFDMPTDGLLILEGVTNPGVIETSSGPGTGGIITIARPLAIILNGGMIMALGESGGANVQIDTPYFIASSDRFNSVAVDGSLTFANAIYDVSAGTVDADLAMVDASGVLRNQCSAARASGELSVLDVRPIGPFGPTAAVEGPRPVEPGAVSGGCN
jgi:filamentous hemagglutinin family protein